MRAHGHVLVWGTQAGKPRASEAKGWYQQLKAWWIAHTAARRQAQLVTPDACWDATHEAVRPLRAEAAPEMAAAHGALTVATLLCCLSH